MVALMLIAVPIALLIFILLLVCTLLLALVAFVRAALFGARARPPGPGGRAEGRENVRVIDRSGGTGR
jgi:hypothetical protein